MLREHRKAVDGRLAERQGPGRYVASGSRPRYRNARSYGENGRTKLAPERLKLRKRPVAGKVAPRCAIAVTLIPYLNADERGAELLGRIRHFGGGTLRGCRS